MSIQNPRCQTSNKHNCLRVHILSSISSKYIIKELAFHQLLQMQYSRGIVDEVALIEERGGFETAAMRLSGIYFWK
jgi:hypothetical protein